MDLNSSFLNMSKTWLQGPLALSKESCRFELPMDVCRLSEMSVLDYLTDFCVICSRRKQLYRQSFMRADKDRDGYLNLAEFKDTLTNVIYVQSDAQTCIEELLKLITEDQSSGPDQSEWQDEFKVDLKRFRGIAAFFERMLCSLIDKRNTSDGIRWSQCDRRNALEQTDFDGLKWKLKGCQIDSKLMAIFNYL